MLVVCCAVNMPLFPAPLLFQGLDDSPPPPQLLLSEGLDPATAYEVQHNLGTTTTIRKIRNKMIEF